MLFFNETLLNEQKSKRRKPQIYRLPLVLCCT